LTGDDREPRAHTADNPSLAARAGRALVVASLLALHWLLAISASWSKSMIFDEPVHQAAGYSYWRLNDFRLHPENGNLPQRLAALPLLRSSPRFPDLDQQAWHDSDIWEIGRQFYFGLDNDTEGMVHGGRMTMALVSCALGLVVFAWSSRLFGFRSGCLTLALFAFSPTALAHGPLMTSDVTAALCFLAAVSVLWLQLQRVSIATMTLGGLAFGALFLAKMSALLVLPMSALLLAIRVVSNRPWILPWRTSVTPPGWVGRLGIGSLVIVSNLLITWLLVWAAFGFRFEVRATTREHEALYFSDEWEQVRQGGGLTAASLDFLHDHRLLPEAYIYGVGVTVAKSQKRRSFMDGRWSEVGWPSFFPYAFAIKTSLGEIAVVVLAASAGVRWWWRRRRTAAAAPAIVSFAYATAPLLVLFVVYWAIAIPSRLNIGHRHLFPTYPVLWILAGGAALWAGHRWRGRLVLIATAVLLLVESLFVWPDYLAYFNVFAGGPSHGYHRLVDSSLDWGQDLPGLARWLDAHQRDERSPVYFSYFGSSLPTHYGIRARMLPSYLSVGETEEPRDLEPGLYCISATMLQSVYLDCPGSWSRAYEQRYQVASDRVNAWRSSEGKVAARQALLDRIGEEHWLAEFAAFEHLRFGRLAAHLRQREPDAVIGHSILIFRLDADELRSALSGPPAELED
jgi:hypothetical protein